MPDGAQGTDSLLCGNSGSSGGSADNLTAVGVDVTYSGDSVTLVGSNAIAQSSGFFVGSSGYTRPSDPGATGVGAYAFVSGLGSVAIGDQATVGVVDFSSGYSLTSGVNGGTAVGSSSLVTGNGGTAIGFRSQSNGVGSTAVGAASNADAASATAVGFFARALGDGSTSLGTFAVANDLGGLAIGAAAFASMTGSSPFGAPTVPGANLIGAMAVGTVSQALGGDSTALGNYAVIGNYNDPTVVNGATAIGAASHVTAANATTIGARSTASAANSVALGYGSVANQANTVSVGTVGGERRVVNVAAGTAPTDAVNVSQLNAATTNFNAGLATQQGEIDNLYSMERRDRRDIKQGVAAAVAIANAPLPSGPGKVSYAFNGASFRGEFAVGGSINYRLNTEAPVAFGFGVSHGGGKNTAVRVGIAGEF